MGEKTRKYIWGKKPKNEARHHLMRTEFPRKLKLVNESRTN